MADIQVVTAAGSGQALSNAVRTRYVADYIRAAMMERLYDQFAVPVAQDMSRVSRGSSVTLNFLGDMEPGTSAISEVVDITPQVLRDATVEITPTSRAEALQASELLMLQSYTNYGKERYEAVGKNMMETVDLLARDVATKGDIVIREVARASLDAGSTGHRASDSLFTKASSFLNTLKTPGFPVAGGQAWMAVMHPAAYHDIREDGNVVSIAQYQNQQIILNFELGSIGPFRLVVSPWAKVFGGAGADHDDVVATTLSTAENALAKTIHVASATHVDTMPGKWLTIGTEETGSTHYPKNERAYVTAVASATINIAGEAANAGLRFDHASGTAVRNADSVYTIVFGGPQSLVKVFQPEVGEYGQVVGPKLDGIVDQFVSLGYKFYGGYGLIAQNRLLRAEVSASMDA